MINVEADAFCTLPDGKHNDHIDTEARSTYVGSSGTVCSWYDIDTTAVVGVTIDTAVYSITAVYCI